MSKSPSLRSPIIWFGGKGMMRNKLLPIINNIPHKHYVEPFGSGATILLAKTPSPIETYNDIDGGLYDFFKVVSDPGLFEDFYNRVSHMPRSRRLYNESLETYKDEPDLIKRVSMWYVVARQSFGGRFGSGWGYSLNESSRGMASAASRWLSALEMLPRIHERLQKVQIENKDWRGVFENLDTENTLFYVDPPYLQSTRKAQKYSHELSEKDHVELVEVLLKTKGSVVLSGYPNDVYLPLEHAGWDKKSWETVCHVAGRTRNSNLKGKGAATKHQKRTEVVWIKKG